MSNKKPKASTRLTAEIVNERLAPRGMRLVGDFIPGKVKNKFKCRNGHEFLTRADGVMGGQDCPYCSVNTPLSQDAIESRLAGLGIRMTGKYTNSTTKTEFTCDKGHVWRALPAPVLNQKSGCPICSGNQPLTKEIINQRLSPYGIRMTGEYINTTTKTEFICSEGHEFTARPGNILNRRRCATCNTKERLTTEIVNARLAGRGIRLIGEIVTGKTKTEFTCDKGHVWQAAPTDVLSCKGCPICSCSHPLTKEIVNERLAERGIWLSGEYTSSATKTDFTCDEGHVWSSAPAWMLTAKGKGCPHCYGNARLTKEIVNARLIPRGIRLTGEYVMSMAKTEFTCDEGHVWWATSDSVMRGNGCPHCANHTPLTKEIVNERLALRGIQLIGEYITANHIALFECAEGHQWRTRPGDVMIGKGCRACGNVGGYRQSSPGSLYVLASTDGAYIKIGISNKPQKRVSGLRMSTPFEFHYLQIHESDNGQVAQAIETEAHQILKEHNAGLTGFDGATEWFKAVRPVIEFISLL